MTLDPADRRALERELAATSGGIWVRCAGRSMEPTLRLGARVQVVASGSPRIGEVVLLETADGRDLVLHRVVFALPLLGWFWHDGDAGRPDPARAHVSQIIGRALLDRRAPRLAALPALAIGAARGAWRRLRGRRNSS